MQGKKSSYRLVGLVEGQGVLETGRDVVDDQVLVHFGGLILLRQVLLVAAGHRVTVLGVPHTYYRRDKNLTSSDILRILMTRRDESPTSLPPNNHPAYLGNPCYAD